MYFIEEFQQDDVSFKECVMTLEVSYDELENNKVRLLMKPYAEDIKIVRYWYHDDNTFEGSQIIDCFKLDLFYDSEHDRIELALKSSLDSFVYSVCRLLNIGRITLYNHDVEEIERRENVSTISENHIRSVILTLEEFKCLDGFCGVIDISGLSKIHFKGLHMSVKALKESVCDDFRRPDSRKEYYLRGEKLFKWD